MGQGGETFRKGPGRSGAGSGVVDAAQRRRCRGWFYGGFVLQSLPDSPFSGTTRGYRCYHCLGALVSGQAVPVFKNRAEPRTSWHNEDFSSSPVSPLFECHLLESLEVGGPSAEAGSTSGVGHPGDAEMGSEPGDVPRH